jgi:carbon monoxide dehydrogenase subunit G
LELTHRFTVPTPVEETWGHFQDIASIAECFPGAAVTSVEGDAFHGTVKVKLGPIALVYNGSGTFVERDADAHRFVVDAKGKDKRGNGTAGAKVTLEMHPSDGAEGTATDVEVVTDLAITGKPAQFGRGVMQDVSDKLLGQFVDCLEHRLGGPPDEPSDVVAPATDGPTPPPAPVTAGEPADQPSAARVVSPPPGPSTTTRPPRPEPPSGDALDLGATVLPILVRSYWKPALAAALVVLVVVRWMRRG